MGSFRGLPRPPLSPQDQVREREEGKVERLPERAPSWLPDSEIVANRVAGLK